MATPAFPLYDQAVNERAMPQRTEPDNDRRQRQVAAPFRILVVDDEPVLLNLIASALLEFGYHVDTAEDGLAAWNTLQAQRYDLLITDNNMPTMSGFELLDKLHQASKSLPSIMATGAAPEDGLARKPWLQSVVTLLKPFTIIDLLVTVKKSLANETTFVL